MTRFFKNFSFDRGLFVGTVALFLLSMPLTLFHPDYPDLSFIERPQPGLRLLEKGMDALGFPREIDMDEMRFPHISIESPAFREAAPPSPLAWDVASISKPFVGNSPLPQQVKKKGPPKKKEQPMLVKRGQQFGDMALLFVGMMKAQKAGALKVVLKDLKTQRHHLLEKGEQYGGVWVKELVFHTAILNGQNGRQWILTTQPGESTVLLTHGEK